MRTGRPALRRAWRRPGPLRRAARWPCPLRRASPPPARARRGRCRRHGRRDHDRPGPDGGAAALARCPMGIGCRCPTPSPSFTLHKCTVQAALAPQASSPAACHCTSAQRSPRPLENSLPATRPNSPPRATITCAASAAVQRRRAPHERLRSKELFAAAARRCLARNPRRLRRGLAGGRPRRTALARAGTGTFASGTSMRTPPSRDRSARSADT